MKRIVLTLSIFLLFFFSFRTVSFADNDDWKTQPIITSVFESDDGQITLEWEGNADIYQLYVDGKIGVTTTLSTTSLNLKNGSHRISVVPIQYESKNADTRIEIGFNALNNIGIEGVIDLGSLGIDPKDLFQGTPSKTLTYNQRNNPFFKARAEIKGAATDFKDHVHLSFSDKYESDIYRIAVVNGKDITYVDYDTLSKGTEKYIKKTNSTVTVELVPEVLKKQGCMIPELDEKYSFKVILLKHPVNQITGEKVVSSVLSSDEGKSFSYIPTAAWKNPPTITYASQTADGQITLRWQHEDNGLGCKYEVLILDKVLNVKKGERIIGTTSSVEYVVKDLMNGKHSFAIRPILSSENGIASDTVTIDVKNNWVTAPSLTCSFGTDNKVNLKWDAAEGVESYHFTVYSGSGSVLRYINLDFNKYKEFDVTANSPQMQYTFSYGDDAVTDSGVKLKFEVFGIRHAENGSIQQSATSSQIISK